MTLVACIGGGQLGRMLGLARPAPRAQLPLPRSVPEAPAGQVGELVVGAFDDPDALARLAAGADVVTYEFENVPVEAARRLAPLPPPRALELGQDRLVEKELFRRLGIPTARFGSLDETGLPALVKSRRLGYDGKGQRRLETPGEIGDGRARRGDRPLRPRALDPRRARPRRRDALLAARGERPPRRDPARLPRAGRTAHRRPRRRSSRRGCSTSSATSACSRSSCSRPADGCSRTSSRRASTTPATGRSTARSRVSSRTTCGRSSDCRSVRPRRGHGR